MIYSVDRTLPISIDNVPPRHSLDCMDSVIAQQEVTIKPVPNSKSKSKARPHPSPSLPDQTISLSAGRVRFIFRIYSMYHHCRELCTRQSQGLKEREDRTYKTPGATQRLTSRSTQLGGTVELKGPRQMQP
jgi:hypothetical protein